MAVPVHGLGVPVGATLVTVRTPPAIDPVKGIVCIGLAGFQAPADIASLDTFAELIPAPKVSCPVDGVVRVGHALGHPAIPLPAITEFVGIDATVAEPFCEVVRLSVACPAAAPSANV